ncbi:MAG TPA: thermonuclease family protein [Candidatus Woesebacteria bacterium]|nr:thermonuclease family protein [Candidatus Woesebacteria bacterium]
MPRNLKLFQLYILPFLIIAALLFFEKIEVAINQLQPFEEVAQNTAALAEVDYRKMEKATVKRVVDGDTIELETGEKVRYIGIDTPETKHPNKPIQCFGKEASNKNKELVEGKEVLLETDVSNTDRYNRLLRYVYLPNPEATDEAIFVNEYLVEQGYAHVYTYPPDVKYDTLLKNAEAIAREEQKGLWKSCN